MLNTDVQTAWATFSDTLGRASALIISYSFSLAGALLLLVVGYFLAGFAQRWVDAGLSHIHGFDLTLRQFLAQFARYGVLALVFVMVLGQFGVQTTSIIAAIGAIGLAIGLALQGTLQNIAAGVMLLVLRPFRVGEDVQVGALRAVVEDIGLFATTLRSGDGLFLFAPNSTLWNQPVTNYSRNGDRRADLPFQIGLRDDVDGAIQALEACAAADPRVHGDRPPAAFVAALGETAVTVTLRYWTSAADFAAVQADLTKAGKLALDARFAPAKPDADA